jgi:hypothetical protein
MGRGSVMGHWALSSVLHTLKIIIKVLKLVEIKKKKKIIQKN